MTTNEFMKFLQDCEARGDKESAAAILFQLSREEMETNTQYAAALQTIKRILGKNPAHKLAYEKQMNDFFQAVMTDENDHCMKFQWAASELMNIPVGHPEHVGKPIK